MRQIDIVIGVKTLSSFYRGSVLTTLTNIELPDNPLQRSTNSSWSDICMGSVI